METSKIPMEINSAMENVRRIMANYPQARNSDLALCFIYWQNVNGVRIELPHSKMKNITNPETITRARRLIQADGFLLPTDPEVMAQRRKRESEIRKYLSERRV